MLDITNDKNDLKPHQYAWLMVHRKDYPILSEVCRNENLSLKEEFLFFKILFEEIENMNIAGEDETIVVMGDKIDDLLKQCKLPAFI